MPSVSKPKLTSKRRSNVPPSSNSLPSVLSEVTAQKAVSCIKTPGTDDSIEIHNDSSLNGDADMGISSSKSNAMRDEKNGVTEIKDIPMEVDDNSPIEPEKNTPAAAKDESNGSAVVMKIGSVEILPVNSAEEITKSANEPTTTVTVTAVYSNSTTVVSSLENLNAKLVDSNHSSEAKMNNENPLATDAANVNGSVVELKSDSTKTEDINQMTTISKSPLDNSATANGIKLEGQKKAETEEEKYVNGIPTWVILYCEKPECEERAYGSYPCFRCYKANYCSTEHRNEHEEAHQADCKIDSKLDGALNDKQYVAWHKLASGHLYDTILNFILVWPTPSVQFLPEVTTLPEGQTRHNIMIGTQTDGEQNHLLLCTIDIPPKAIPPRATHDGVLRISKRIIHEGEVNRARYMPQNPDVVATKTPKSDVLIYDCSKHPELPNGTDCIPEIRLLGHEKEGFALAWNNWRKGRLISGSYDNKICMWDINGTPGHKKTLQPVQTFKGHTDAVGSISWHCDEEYLFASVGDDKNLIIWDIRSRAVDQGSYVINDAHAMNVNAVSFNPFSEYLLATGSSDKTVALWDLRNMKLKLHSMEYHEKDVYHVEWSPHDPFRLASAGNDNQVFIWDISKIGSTPDENDEYYADSDEPPELMFIHGGHAGVVNDICWNENEPGMMCSASDNDNFLQIWKLSKDLYENRGDKTSF